MTAIADVRTSTVGLINDQNISGGNILRNWEIKSRSRACAACAAPFQTGQMYHCLLSFAGAEPARADYCERCFQEKIQAAARSGPEKAYWRSAFKRLYTPVEEREAIRKDMAQRLLEKYVSSEQPEHVNLCYILALLQERSRILIPRTRTRDEGGVWITVYEHVQSGDTFLIRDPGLSLSEAEAVEGQIKALIEAEKAASEAAEKEGAGDQEAGDEQSPAPIGDQP